jgi:crotonobetainyl-CoA:carnitine CoA-transferase CaiB-like acyl-CoA transferase
LHRDTRFRSNRDRVARREAVVGAIAARLAAMPRAEVLAALEAGGVPAGPINTVAEAFAEPQAVARGAVLELGGSRTPRSPMRFSDAGVAAELPPPRLDEHGPAIRAALAAGASWPSLSRRAASG